MSTETNRDLARDQAFAMTAAAAIVAGQGWIMMDLHVAGRWLVSSATIVLLIVIAATYLMRRRQWRIRRAIEIGLAALLVIIDVVNLLALGQQAFFLDKPTAALELLFTGAILWVMNVLIFAIFYWLLDAGGPDLRASGQPKQPDFVFPQQTDPQNAQADWGPGFGDYLYLAFTGATSFGPTDAMPYTRRAKAAMAIEGGLALITLGVIIARAVSLATD